MRKRTIALWSGAGTAVIVWFLNTSYTEFRLLHPIALIETMPSSPSPVAQATFEEPAVKASPSKDPEAFHLYIEVVDEQFFVDDNHIAFPEIEKLIRTECETKTGYNVEIYPDPSSSSNHDLAIALMRRISRIRIPSSGVGIINKRPLKLQ